MATKALHKRKTKGAANLHYEYKSFRLSKPIKADVSDIPSSFKLFGQTLVFLNTHKKKILAIAAIYGLLYVIFVRSRVPFDLEETKIAVEEWVGSNHLINSAALTGLVVGLAGSAGDELTSLYNVMLFVVGSLAYIWAIRHLSAKKSFRTKDAFYKGMYPLIPFTIICLIIMIQMTPFSLGSFLYNTADAGGLFLSFAERFAFLLIWFFMSLLSAFWLSNSVMGLYASTLPDVDPLQALRATKKIVAHRRWVVFKRIAMLGILLLLTFGMFLLSIVAIAPQLAFHAYDLIIILSLPFVHVYLYKLYRSLA